MLFYGSASRHGVAHKDALHVIEHARTIIILREDPEKLLHVGFDTLGRPLEVITDTSVETGRVAVIHACKLTPSYREFL